MLLALCKNLRLRTLRVCCAGEIFKVLAVAGWFSAVSSTVAPWTTYKAAALQMQRYLIQLRADETSS